MICELKQRHPWIVTVFQRDGVAGIATGDIDDALTVCEPWADSRFEPNPDGPPIAHGTVTPTHIHKALLTERARRQQLDKYFIGLIGKRYAGCTLDNFQIRQQGQQKAVDQLRAFIADFQEHPRNLIIFGPTGTGKDHLAVACARAVMEAYGLGVYWINGQELFADARGDRNGVAMHRMYLRHRAVLLLSDPTAISGPITPFQSETLYGFLDPRYRELEPTWATVNVSSRKELRERIGAPNADRLLDGAEVLYTNWPSYRQSRNSKQEHEHGTQN